LTLPKNYHHGTNHYRNSKYANAALVVTKANGIPGTTKVVGYCRRWFYKNTYFVVFKHPAQTMQP
jgi:hypothetical protein